MRSNFDLNVLSNMRADLGLGLWTNTRIHVQDRTYVRMGCGGRLNSCARPRTRLTGPQGAEIRSKHGIILSCRLEPSVYADESLKGYFALLSMTLEGQRYGFVDDKAAAVASQDERIAGVWDWLRTAMDS